MITKKSLFSYALTLASFFYCAPQAQLDDVIEFIKIAHQATSLSHEAVKLTIKKQYPYWDLIFCNNKEKGLSNQLVVIYFFQNTVKAANSVLLNNLLNDQRFGALLLKLSQAEREVFIDICRRSDQNDFAVPSEIEGSLLTWTEKMTKNSQASSERLINNIFNCIKQFYPELDESILAK